MKFEMEPGVIYDNNGNVLERLQIAESPIPKLRAANPEQYAINEARFKELAEVIRWGHFVGDYMGQIQLAEFIAAVDESRDLAVALGYAQEIK